MLCRYVTNTLWGCLITKLSESSIQASICVSFLTLLETTIPGYLSFLTAPTSLLLVPTPDHPTPSGCSLLLRSMPLFYVSLPPTTLLCPANSTEPSCVKNLPLKWGRRNRKRKDCRLWILMVEPFCPSTEIIYMLAMLYP